LPQPDPAPPPARLTLQEADSRDGGHWTNGLDGLG